MSNIRHRLIVGANVVADVDELFNPPDVVGFTFDRDDIFFDSTLRTMDETLI